MFWWTMPEKEPEQTPIKECRKIKYHSHSSADRAARDRAHKNNRNARVYFCDQCNGWHVTTRPERRNRK